MAYIEKRTPSIRIIQFGILLQRHQRAICENSKRSSWLLMLVYLFIIFAFTFVNAWNAIKS